MAIGRIPEPGTGIPESIVDAKGDLVTATAADTPARLAVGTNEHRLVAASGEATGLKYVADTTNYAIAAKGDLLVGTAADTLQALSVGTNGHTLVADSTETTGLKWAAPSSPSFVGCLVNADNQSTSNGVETTINFPNEVIDTNGFHSTTTNTSRITIPSGYGGKYLLVCQIRYADGAGTYRSIYFRQNGTDKNTIFIPAASGFSNVVAASCVLSAVATDYFEIQARQNSGGNLNVEGGAASTTFAAIYLGA